MALTDAQRISWAYKRLMGVTETSTEKAYFEEPFLTEDNIKISQIWRDADKIPAQAPIIFPTLENIDGEEVYYNTYGVLGYVLSLTLRPVEGVENAFYHPFLKDAIPFNFDPEGSYNYALTTYDENPISFGTKDWVLDPISGVLTFYGDALEEIGITAEKPPKISFYKYKGRKGVLPFTDDTPILEDIDDPTKKAQFFVNGDVGTTLYKLPKVENNIGTIVLEENLNDAIAEAGNIDGGEYL